MTIAFQFSSKHQEKPEKLPDKHVKGQAPPKKYSKNPLHTITHPSKNAPRAEQAETPRRVSFEHRAHTALAREPMEGIMVIVAEIPHTQGFLKEGLQPKEVDKPVGKAMTLVAYALSDIAPSGVHCHSCRITPCLAIDKATGTEYRAGSAR